MNDIKVLIVEDDPLIAEDIRELLSEMKYSIVGVAYNKVSALGFLKNDTPQIALLDINLGNNTDGIGIAEVINEQYKIPFIYLTSYATKIILEKVKHTHPMGYIVKPFNEQDLFTAIEIALSNYVSFNPTKTLALETLNENLPNQLTQKEYEVVKDIYNGKTNLEMAEDNFVSINTIKTHIQRVYEKLNVNSRATAMVKIRSLIKRN